MWRAVLVLGAAYVLAVAWPHLRVEEKDAAGLAAEFAEDPYAAARKYVRRPVAGIDDYPLVQTSGVVEAVRDRDGRGFDVHLGTESEGVALVLRAGKLRGENRQGVARGRGFVSSFDGRTIVIECPEVTFEPGAGG